ncbi:MAG: hypothetical protein OEM39_01360 [Acidimicrobiia bacterium]|nr:hypothetical protein [Acidimicrobiia bacterium]MDH3462823.1 hypothetical protein [Acidimicrobiia bacterium]
MGSPSDDELERAAELIEYERYMLVGTHMGLTNARAEFDVETFVHNSFLEAFLFHCRNLWDFFESDEGRGGIHASHYAVGWQPAVSLDPEIRATLDMRLSRLTYVRLEKAEVEEEWAIDQMLIDVIAVFNQFLDSLTPERKRWFLSKYEVDIEELDLDSWERS